MRLLFALLVLPAIGAAVSILIQPSRDRRRQGGRSP